MRTTSPSAFEDLKRCHLCSLTCTLAVEPGSQPVCALVSMISAGVPRGRITNLGSSGRGSCDAQQLAVPRRLGSMMALYLSTSHN